MGLPPRIFLLNGVWNSLEYGLFGYGDHPAVFLGNSRWLYDPEEGLAGSAVLLAAALFLLLRIKKTRKIREER